MRYQVGQPQQYLTPFGRRYEFGINQYRPRTEGRTPRSAARKYLRWLRRSGWPGVGDYCDWAVWDSKAEQFITVLDAEGF